MKKAATLAAAALLSTAAVPPPPPPGPDAALRVPRTAAAEVSAERLHATVEKLVSFGTRHTLSSMTDPRRGIGAAEHWVQEEFGRYSAACGGCLQIITPEEDFKGTRAPGGVRIRDVVAIQRGTGDPNRVVIISGHIDSRVTDVMNATADAPGANDDGSGTAAVIEAARVLSKHKFPAPSSTASDGRGAGPLRRQDSRRLRQGAGLAGRGGPQQRHCRQQLRLGRDAATRPTSGSSRKGRAGRGTRTSPPASAASAARMTRPAATSRAGSTRLADRLKLGLDVRRSGATTASAAAATTASSSTSASRRCASPSPSKITTGSTRI
jgi:hypothetical protein